jgi:hypothetical protein
MTGCPILEDRDNRTPVATSQLFPLRPSRETGHRLPGLFPKRRTLADLYPRIALDGFIGVAKSARRAKHFDFAEPCQAPKSKIFCFTETPNQVHNSLRPGPSEGRFAVVTKRWVWDAMDAAASGAFAPDENAAAYGEVVWSWRRDPGVYPARLCGHGNGDKKGRSPGRARRKP